MKTIATILPRSMHDGFSLRLYRLRSQWERLAVAWRYFRGTWTEDDADKIRWDAQTRGGVYPLELFTVQEVQELALERWNDHPRLAALCQSATARVASKWSSDGELAWSAKDWALELVEHYAQSEGVFLEGRDDE